MIKNKNYILSKNDFYLINEFLQKSNDIDIKEVNKIIENLIEYLRGNDCNQIEIDSIDLLNL